MLAELDLYLLAEGTHRRTWEKLGAHLTVHEGVPGTHFAVWAPNARKVCVLGGFNGWQWGGNPMKFHEIAGVWETFIPNVGEGALYKFAIESKFGGPVVEKSDPYAFACEVRPNTASKVCRLDRHQWQDGEWMKSRHYRQSLDAPITVYELHLGSWARKFQEEGKWHSYRDLAKLLVEYVVEMGFTHVEFLPLTEHPFDGSWGYQTLGYFAATSRFGPPEDLMYLIDVLHQNDIGVILDWVPAHFPKDVHGLALFDGTHLYEHADPRKGVHKDWNTFIYNYGRRQVQNFLISSALFWMEKFHIDGVRVDAVASMLYLDYSRGEGEWVPNKYGGRENLEAIEFIRRFNDQVHAEFPGVLTIAEESTSWPMVSKPTYLGGLGFDMKWNMGWMHDTLDYMKNDPIHRKFHHRKITFSLMYAFAENFMLPFSHDEVVHMKGSMLRKMPGDLWQKFANLRLLYGFMYGHPGKKLLFMGGEFGQWKEWNHDGELQWELLADARHEGLRQWVRALNLLHYDEPALHEVDTNWKGFQWIDCDDAIGSVISFLRYGYDPNDALMFVANFTPVVRGRYRIGLPWAGEWTPVLNSDDTLFGGSGVSAGDVLLAEDTAHHGRPASVELVLPPLAMQIFRGRNPHPVPVKEIPRIVSDQPDPQLLRKRR